MQDTCDIDSDVDTCDHVLIKMGKLGLVTNLTVHVDTESDVDTCKRVLEKVKT